MNFLRISTVGCCSFGASHTLIVLVLICSTSVSKSEEPVATQPRGSRLASFFKDSACQNSCSRCSSCDSDESPLFDVEEVDEHTCFTGEQAWIGPKEATSFARDSERSPEGIFENWGRIYHNNSNSRVQEVWLLGRYHGQQHWADGNSGNSSGWESRRYRMGTQARVFEHATLHAQMVSGSDFEPFYNGFTELWAQWEFSDQIALTVGQQKHRFTHDRNVSSRYITTIERSQLVNMFRADYTPAVTLQDTIEKLSYYSGIFSNATGPDVWQAFTELNSGCSLLTNAYYDFTEETSIDSAHLGLSYVWSDANVHATNLNVFEHGISGVIILTEGPASVVSEAVAGLESNLGDAYGLNVQGGYFITNKVQLATRFQFAASEDSNGLSAQLRYEQPAGFTTGDTYHAEYIGTNYFVAGHRIKWMNGIEHSELNGDSLWTFSTAIRIFWGPHSNGPFPMASLLPGRW